MDASTETHTVAADTTATAHNDTKERTPDSRAAAADWQGKTLKSRYQLGELLGSGGMSDVYRATDLHLAEAGAHDSDVAVKILRSELTQDSNALRLLAKEAAKSKKLSHPNIIRVYDFDHDDDTWFMVMEVLDGEPLSKVIQRAKPQGMKWTGAKSVLEQIVSALNYSHQRGIVHADLKPSNIFVTRDYTIKLLDFGVAQALKPSQHEDYLHQPENDETTIYGYTPAYASSSLIAGKEPQFADDVYALSCVTYELLSSRHPFERKRLSSEERQQFKLEKPANMPWRLWLVIKSVLHEQKAYELTTFQRAMAGLPVAHIAYPVLLVAALGFAGYFWQQGSSDSGVLRAQLAAYQQHNELLSELSSESVSDLLDSLSDINNIERAGLLAINRDRVIDYFTKRADAALKTAAGTDLPNFPAAQKILDRAHRYYPHDEALQTYARQLNQRRMSLFTALSDELTARLVQGNYENADALADLESLKDDLLFLNDQMPSLPEAAVNTYIERLQTAIDNDDAAAMQRLLNVGERFFSDTEQANDLIAQTKQLQTAIQQLADYEKAVADGGDADYPLAAAEQFYARRIERWQAQIAEAKSSDQLDAVYDELQNFETSLPVKLPPLHKLEQQLARAYITEANALLKAKKVSAAAPLMQRANELMSRE